MTVEEFVLVRQAINFLNTKLTQVDTKKGDATSRLVAVVAAGGRRDIRRPDRKQRLPS
jgi:hypothetical protein